MLQKILNCLIEDEIEETKKLVGDITINIQNNIDNNSIAGLVPLLMFTSSTIMLSNLETSKCLLERLEKEESEIGLKLSKTCFLFRKYYTRKLKKVSKEIFETKKNISFNKWELISLVYYAQKIIDNKEETKNE
jgi:chromosome segregation and condensation protein ScpB